MDVTERISLLITPTLESMGYDLVRVQLSGGTRPVLQIMAERHNDHTMSIDDCSAISLAVSALLDVENPLPGAYHLEVSSPGIDRPLTRLKDFEHFAGHEARVETRLPIDGKRRFKGILKGLHNEGILMDTENGPIHLPFAHITRAKLVLTEALMASAASSQPPKK